MNHGSRGRSAGKAAPARAAALQALLEVEQQPEIGSGQALDRAILAQNLDPRDARLATAIVLGVLRRALWLDLQYSGFLRHDPLDLDPGIRMLFRMAACQKHLMERIPPHAIASDSVELARAWLRVPSHKTGFVNAVVRRIVQMSASVAPSRGARLERLAAATSHPEWLIELLEKKFGAEAAARILEMNNTEAPMTLRANRLVIGDRAVLAQSLAVEGIVTTDGELSPDALLLEDSGRLRGLIASPLFEAGAFYLQDEASQAVALLAAPRPGERVLDLCSAPGGKATHLAELSGGKAQVVATDVSESRLALVRENAARLRTPGLEVLSWGHIFGEEAKGEKETEDSSPAESTEHTGFDLVLVDAPCSGLGTLRRNPEIRYRSSPAVIKRLADDQKQILRDAAALVRPGGRLVYSTCTVTDEENRGAVTAFLAEHSDFRLAESETTVERLKALRDQDGFYRTWPECLGVDGFEAAVLRRAG